VEKSLKPGPTTAKSAEEELAKIRAAASAVQQMRLATQHELALARQMRAEAQKYLREMETKGRSEAQQLILRGRLDTKKEIEELIRQTSADIKKFLDDIRVIRITAQEELAAQKKITDAARLTQLSLELDDQIAEPNGKKKRELAFKQ
jgi:hypothetical protein